METLFDLKYEAINSNNLYLIFDIQRKEWKYSPDFNDLYNKTFNQRDDNIEFLVYNKDNNIIGITGVDIIDSCKDSIWLNWFVVLDKYRRKGYGKKILLDTIEYCKRLNRYKYFRIDTTYKKGRPAMNLYNKVMDICENYTVEDDEEYKSNCLIYTKALIGKAKPLNNKFLGLRQYYDNCKSNNIQNDKK